MPRPKYTIEEAISTAEKFKGKLLSPLNLKIVNRQNTIIEFECDNSHKFSTTPRNLDKGSFCPFCSGLKLLDPIGDLRKIVESRGGELLSTEYKNRTTKVKCRCSQGHEFDIRPECLITGQFCKDCSSFISERICRKWFETIFNSEFRKSRPDWLVNQNGNKIELDGFSPELNIAFEFQGEQHYGNTSMYTQPKFDELKVTKCKENNVSLFIIPFFRKISDFPKIKEIIRDQAKDLGVSLREDLDTVEIDLKSIYSNTFQIEKLESIKEKLDKLKIKLLSDKFIHTQIPLEFECIKCNRQHKWLIHHIPKNGCSTCNTKVGHKVNIESINKDFIEYGKIISSIYKDVHTELICECKCGVVFKNTYKSLQRKVWCCPGCSKRKMKKNIL